MFLKGRHIQSLAAYRSVFSELSIAENGIVLRGERIVPPSSLWLTYVELAHEGHQGMVKTKRLLRSKLWFPGIDRLDEKRIADCLACQAYSRDEPRPDSTMTELPPEPWHTVASDFFVPHDSFYITVVYDVLPTSMYRKAPLIVPWETCLRISPYQ